MAAVIAHSNEPLVIPAQQVPSTAKLSVKVGTKTEQVPLNFVRGNWAFIASFPDAGKIPPGTHSATLPSAAGSLSIELRVQAAPSRHRVLVPARNKPNNPYTILIIANPRLQRANNTQIVDPVTQNRGRFNMMVYNILDGLLNFDEDLLAQREDKGLLQVETFFDASLAGDPANCLVVGGVRVPNAAMVLTVPLKSFLDRQQLRPDVVYLIHDVPEYTRPTGVPGIDRTTGPTKTFLLDGKQGVMGAFPEKPGAVVMSATPNFAQPVAMHEFGHAASLVSCWITDLYDDRSDKIANLNKKKRVKLTDPVPTIFANYNAVDFASAPDRWPSKQYTTASYFPARIAGGQPNLMDQYLSGSPMRACRFDRLTAQWLGDRLDFKMAR